MEETAKVPKEVPRERMPWAEITSDEKIERLREILRRTQATSDELRESLRELRDIATRHEHSHDGHPMVAVDRTVANVLTCGSDRCVPGKEWF